MANSKLYPAILAMASSSLLLVLSSGAMASSQANLASISNNVASTLIQKSSAIGTVNANQSATIQVGMPWRNLSGLKTLIQSQSTPGSPHYHHFLTSAQFRSQFSPTTSTVNQVVQFLTSSGLKVLNISPNRNLITVRGNYGQIQAAFHITLEQYRYHGKVFVANSTNPSVPSSVANDISAVFGLTTYSSFHTSLAHTLGTTQSSSTTPTGYSPQQIANAYQVTPLYKQHALGQGYTIAIATLASFKASDAQTFWKYYHIHRTGSGPSVVPVDGGFTSSGGNSGPGSGRIETSLDVERSGAMAPGANLLVYEAPNTNQGFIDLFNTVVAQDKAQVMSCSWGADELLMTPSYDRQINQIFMEGAAQGQSLFSASGDSGAFDAYPPIPVPSVDFPASSPYITAVGGTTLPINGQVPIPHGSIPMKNEHGWGWSYLLPYYKNFGYPSEAAFLPAIFPVGSGGGTSSVFPKPWYQAGSQFPSATGRLVPDVALNADPFTGYAVYDTNSGTSYGNGWINGFGGTSFASPQWAGFMAVMDSSAKTNLGFANPLFYAAFTSPLALVTPPFRSVVKGNNWFYQNHYGYNQVTGLGSPNLANLNSIIQKF